MQSTSRLPSRSIQKAVRKADVTTTKAAVTKASAVNKPTKYEDEMDMLQNEFDPPPPPPPPRTLKEIAKAQRQLRLEAAKREKTASESINQLQQRLKNLRKESPSRLTESNKGVVDMQNHTTQDTQPQKAQLELQRQKEQLEFQRQKEQLEFQRQKEQLELQGQREQQELQRQLTQQKLESQKKLAKEELNATRNRERLQTKGMREQKEYAETLERHNRYREQTKKTYDEIHRARVEQMKITKKLTEDAINNIHKINEDLTQDAEKHSEMQKKTLENERKRHEEFLKDNAKVLEDILADVQYAAEKGVDVAAKVTTVAAKATIAATQFALSSASGIKNFTGILANGTSSMYKLGKQIGKTAHEMNEAVKATSAAKADSAEKAVEKAEEKAEEKAAAKQTRTVREVKTKGPTNEAKFLMQNYEQGHTNIDIRKTGKHGDILAKEVVTERVEEIPKGGRSRRRLTRRRQSRRRKRQTRRRGRQTRRRQKKA